MGEPLLMLDNVTLPKYATIVNPTLCNRTRRSDQVLEVTVSCDVVQVSKGTFNINNRQTKCKFAGNVLKMGLLEEIPGRSFNGFGKVINSSPKASPKAYLDITGVLVKPSSHNYPKTMTQTGINKLHHMRPEDHHLLHRCPPPPQQGGRPGRSSGLHRPAQGHQGLQRENCAIVFGAMG